ncbi:hypothetical protein B0F90DRAFT_1813852 [Multifurca ochricompacta]|uniref:Peroxisome membrane anchor protein Pex14p N-terminal domain-containing protein n=1 Tax=Multifurca ochricompacta TaxID=376703 RepID=A0AAD4MAW9_9AGAM|nr:hypothetical protein B0F90DRAFT_1813852 [Multifurca ochricompacta]
MTVSQDNSQPPAGISEPPSTDTNPPDSSSDRPSLSTLTSTSNRIELLDKARHFLSSPQVVHQDYESKRRFLVEKGLSDGEVQQLLREMLPVVPPRMYPAPTPSNLPGLLVGTFKVLSWLAGGSTALLFIYYRFLLPRLTRSALARRSLKSHQSDLFAKLTESLDNLKEEQRVAYADLPHPYPWEEVVPWNDCKSLNDIMAVIESGDSHVPRVTLLRCALAELATQNKPSTADEVFQVLFSTGLQSLLNIDDAYQESLWKTLNDAPLFQLVEPSSQSEPPRWSYQNPEPAPQPTAPLLPSLTKLQNSVAHAASARGIQRFQHTLQALIDVTGYLTTKTYALASAMHRLPGTASVSATPIEEEEVRLEIKALKGLVLNRRTFMPAIPRPSSAPVDKAS